MLMQAYDFYHLHEVYGCNMQFGGDDQWSNMLAGTELIRKKKGEDAYAMTITLLLNSEGKKMGTTQKGAVWLDENKTTPFEFYQYWRNIDDADVMKCIKMLTFLPMETIADMENWDASRINEKKQILAYELTTLVHGKEKADEVQETARKLFSGAGDDENMPTTTLDPASLSEGKIGLLDLLVITKLAASKSEARRLVTQGGVSVNDEKVTDPNMTVEADAIKAGLKLKKGKKIFHKVTF